MAPQRTSAQQYLDELRRLHDRIAYLEAASTTADTRDAYNAGFREGMDYIETDMWFHEVVEDKYQIWRREKRNGAGV